MHWSVAQRDEAAGRAQLRPSPCHARATGVLEQLPVTVQPPEEHVAVGEPLVPTAQLRAAARGARSSA